MIRVAIGTVVKVEGDAYGDLRFEVDGIYPDGSYRLIMLDEKGKRRKTTRGHFRRLRIDADQVRVEVKS